MSSFLSLLTSSVSKDNVVHTEEKKQEFLSKKENTKRKMTGKKKDIKVFFFLALFSFLVISQVTGETSEEEKRKKWGR